MDEGENEVSMNILLKKDKEKKKGGEKAKENTDWLICIACQPL